MAGHLTANEEESGGGGWRGGAKEEEGVGREVLVDCRAGWWKRWRKGASRRHVGGCGMNGKRGLGVLGLWCTDLEVIQSVEN